jgi:hypothetical protein
MKTSSITFLLHLILIMGWGESTEITQSRPLAGIKKKEKYLKILFHFTCVKQIMWVRQRVCESSYNNEILNLGFSSENENNLFVVKAETIFIIWINTSFQNKILHNMFSQLISRLIFLRIQIFMTLVPSP